ncbi:MAG TPA: hypothetical protein VNK26_02235 [Pyrinomonadaceae bacterium]|nr:hypothetical protein [Pyrinomonadaceae bacterium]
MKKIPIWAAVILALVAFASGFYLANNLNRDEINKLRSQAASPEQPTQNSVQNFELTPQEIEQKLSDARENAQNFAFQKNLGISLYRYGTLRNSPDIIEKSLEPLQRSNSLDPNDYDVIVALGNANFDLGFFKKENKYLQKSREFYQLALSKRPDDADVLCDLGLTFYLEQPPDYERAVSEIEKSLKISPKNERSLQAIIEILRRQGKDAEQYIERLRQVNPSNPILGALTNSPASNSANN